MKTNQCSRILADLKRTLVHKGDKQYAAYWIAT
jgi:hypothetical protein